MERIYYAIGDIHGELSKLADLHSVIDRFHSAHYKGRAQNRIHLGDYVDRGPDSCGVIDFIQALEDCDDFETINLRGNHEVLMTEAQSAPQGTALTHWLVNGGNETLLSYSEGAAAQTQAAHVAWMKTCPTIYTDAARKLVFVHAGIDPQCYPECDPQIHMWTRSPAFFESEHWTNPALEGVTVIHGHTPTLTDYPDISKDGRRINIDTGACYGGPLSAVALAPGCAPQFLFHDQL